MNCFARLVRALLGNSAMADEKLGFGPSLEVLGVQILLSELGWKAVPSRKMIRKCLKVILEALRVDALPSGAAQKLAGRLNWAASYMFHRLGRAMLRAIYDQKFVKCVVVTCMLFGRVFCWARAPFAQAKQAVRIPAGIFALVGSCAEF